MSFRSIVRDVRDSFGSLSRRSFDVRLIGHHRGKSHGSLHDLHDEPLVIQNSCWANLPHELLIDVIKRLEESESTWPARRNVVACASVCRSWRVICKDIVKSPEFCGKLTFPVSLKQPGPRDGTIQCFIKRDKSKLTYHLFLSLSPGVRDENVRTYTPKIVRIGLKPHHSVEAVSMDYLVNQKRDLAGDKKKQSSSGTDIDSIRAAVLDEAVIVFSTLSFSGSAMLTKLNSGFDVVIIDEAAQAVEPATLVPLSSGCKQVFLIGDPVQLPATVISPVAEKFGYGTSLFKRFQRAGYPVKMLKTQYRMHPEIRSFPSKEFYDEALEDGSDVQDQTTRDWHKYRCFGPFCFFDIHEGKESQPSGSGSWVNIDEIEFVLVVYHKLITMYPELKSSSQFAIISPYRHQVKLLQERFQEIFGVESKKVVDIGTIDGFQGREKDVVIFSCVRASNDRGIGFVSDFRRMNVGITRAKSSVLVVGSASTLKNDEHWSNLVESAEKRGRFFKVAKPYASFFNDEYLESMKVIDKDAQMLDGIDAPDNENNATHMAGDADQGPVEDNDYGDGDGDEGGFDDD